MKVLILGAGYGTRLERDLRNDESGTYRHLVGIPKPLLPIGHTTLITHWLNILQAETQVDAILVVTNKLNHASFERWSTEWPKVRLVCDGTTCNEDRIGAVACMNLAVEHFQIEDDLIIIAGDTLFYEDFSLQKTLDIFHDVQKSEEEASLLLYVTCTDQEVHKYGILETDVNNRVIGFLEKPQPDETTSRKECPCFYILSRHSLSMLKQFLTNKKDEPLKSRDATGNFISYIYSRKPVYAAEISGRFDVGGLQSYIVCHQHFLKQSPAS